MYNGIPNRFIRHTGLKNIPLAFTRHSTLINSQRATLLPKFQIVILQRVNALQNVLKRMVVWRGSWWQFTFLYQSKYLVFMKIILQYNTNEFLY